MSTKIKTIAYPSVIVVLAGIFGTMFLSLFAYLSCIKLLSLVQSSQNFDIWIAFSCVAFTLFALITLFKLLTIKKILLTQNELVISYPLLFYNKIIMLSTIKNIFELNYNHSKMHVDGSIYTTYYGKKLIIKLLNNNKKIIITSWEISNYNELAKSFKIVCNNRFKSHLKNKSMIQI